MCHDKEYINRLKLLKSKTLEELIELSKNPDSVYYHFDTFECATLATAYYQLWIMFARIKYEFYFFGFGNEVKFFDENFLNYFSIRMVWLFVDRLDIMLIPILARVFVFSTQ